MKKGKHVEKPVGPMFPRLHVNDTEKGGPRAPPRNKMALYEQFSIPSQRQQQPTSTIPPPRNPNNSTDLGLQASSSRGTGGHEKSSSVYTEFSMSSTPKPDPKPIPKKDEDDFAVPVFVHSMKFQDPRRKHVCNDSRFKVDAVNKENPNPRVGVLNTEKRVQTSDLNLNESRVYSNMVNSKCTNASDEFISCMDTGYTSQPRVDLSLKEQGHVDEISENTIVDSIAVSELSPDDVVTMLGQKCFWRARKQLVNQQRLFALQIFELHRLVTVQKLLAGSPQILLQGDKTSSEKLTLDLAIKPSTTQTPKPKEANVEPLEQIEHSMVGKTNPSTSLNHPHPPIQPPPNNNTQILGTAPETIPGMHPWPYYQTAEHFFVPEMSPSEGFIFKAYPITDFMGPVPHNNNNIPPHPIGYFPQFGISTMNQTLIGQTQPTNPFYPPNGAHISMTSRGSELLQQVSTASSPSVQASDGRNGNTLPLFPTVSTTTKVIKVVPHNATTASESVARIFQSIQEGRK
ncbi:ELF3-like protein 2 [Impatiens glandulifera]|uniref:ELF3-like protein 2 n=1 Tax=Impatiens glandulifera TaxID=253017 RepID=UPI001FB09A2C|nr:ELF3-like protein 2 [Impatiens glandulifera]